MNQKLDNMGYFRVMEGINYIVNDQNNPVSVVIDLKLYGNLVDGLLQQIAALHSEGEEVDEVPQWHKEVIRERTKLYNEGKMETVSLKQALAVLNTEEDE